MLLHLFYRKKTQNAFVLQTVDTTYSSMCLPFTKLCMMGYKHKPDGSKQVTQD